MKCFLLIGLMICYTCNQVNGQSPVPQHDFILALEDRTDNNNLQIFDQIKNYLKAHSAQINKAYLMIEPDSWDDYKGDDNDKNLSTAGKDAARTFRLLNNKGGCSYFFKLSLNGSTQIKRLVLMAWKVDGSNSLKVNPLLIFDFELFASEVNDYMGVLIKQMNHYVISGVSKDAIYVSQISEIESSCEAYKVGLPFFLQNEDLLDRFYVLNFPTTKELQSKMPRRIESQLNNKKPLLVLFNYWDGHKRVLPEQPAKVKCADGDESCKSIINKYCKTIIKQYDSGNF